MSNNESSNKVRYYLASATSRFFARLFDCVVVLLIVFLFGLLIFGTQNKLSDLFSPTGLDNIQNWEYFLLSFVNLIVFYLYFVGLPSWWKGKTVGLFLFKLMIVNVHITRKTFISLLRREVFLWEVVVLISFILGIVLCCLDNTNANMFVKSLLNIESNKYDSYTTIFDAFYYVCGIVLFFMILWMFIKSKKRCIQDAMSDTVVIKIDSQSDKSNQKENKKNTTAVKNYGLPAEVESIDLGEIDKF